MDDEVDVVLATEEFLFVGDEGGDVFVVGGVDEGLEVVPVEVGDLQCIPQTLQPIQLLINIQIEPQDPNMQFLAHRQVVPLHLLQPQYPDIFIFLLFQISRMPMLG